jgi:hypothetical protein
MRRGPRVGNNSQTIAMEVEDDERNDAEAALIRRSSWWKAFRRLGCLVLIILLWALFTWFSSVRGFDVAPTTPHGRGKTLMAIDSRPAVTDNGDSSTFRLTDEYLSEFGKEDLEVVLRRLSARLQNGPGNPRAPDAQTNDLRLQGLFQTPCSGSLPPFNPEKDHECLKLLRSTASYVSFRQRAKQEDESYLKFDVRIQPQPKPKGPARVPLVRAIVKPSMLMFPMEPQGEVAAFVLDRMLGLNRVPPTAWVCVPLKYFQEPQSAVTSTPSSKPPSIPQRNSSAMRIGAGAGRNSDGLVNRAMFNNVDSLLQWHRHRIETNLAKLAAFSRSLADEERNAMQTTASEQQWVAQLLRWTEEAVGICESSHDSNNEDQKLLQRRVLKAKIENLLHRAPQPADSEDDRLQVEQLSWLLGLSYFPKPLPIGSNASTHSRVATTNFMDEVGCILSSVQLYVPHTRKLTDSILWLPSLGQQRHGSWMTFVPMLHQQKPVIPELSSIQGESSEIGTAMQLELLHITLMDFLSGNTDRSPMKNLFVAGAACPFLNSSSRRAPLVAPEDAVTPRLPSSPAAPSHCSYLHLDQGFAFFSMCFAPGHRRQQRQKLKDPPGSSAPTTEGVTKAGEIDSRIKVPGNFFSELMFPHVRAERKRSNASQRSSLQSATPDPNLSRRVHPGSGRSWKPVRDLVCAFQKNGVWVREKVRQLLNSPHDLGEAMSNSSRTSAAARSQTLLSEALLRGVPASVLASVGLFRVELASIRLHTFLAWAAATCGT